MTPAEGTPLRRVGKILRAHGVMGECKVVPDLTNDEAYAGLERVWIGETPEKATHHRVTTVRFQHNARGWLVLLGLEAIDGREAAEALRGRDVFAAMEDLPETEQSALDVDQVIGLTVIVDGVAIGTVSDVLDLPAHPTLVISRDGKPDALVPAVPAFLETMDLAAGRLVLTPIEGLLDD